MNKEIPSHLGQIGQAVVLDCEDGLRLHGHIWSPQDRPAGRVIINAATGVVARYYHRYAAFLAGRGFEVLTWDYRGIGLSRPQRLRGAGYRWRDWGERDFSAALRFMETRPGRAPIMVIGHSIGGFLPGLAANAPRIDRMLTIGAQYAWPGDYARHRRWWLWLKWHVAMPVLTAFWGYFPGRRLGWLEDLPAGVAYEWAFRRSQFERSHPANERLAIVGRMAAVRADILAVAVSDDELGTPAAIRRTLDYYRGARRHAVLVKPADYGRERIGHFQLFHSTCMESFWEESLIWLREGRNPWSKCVLLERDPEPGS